MKIKHEISKSGLRKEQRAIARSDKWVLYLYVAGQTQRCVTALVNLRAICKGQLGNKYQIKEIDLLKNPRFARENQILAVPTLMRKFPLPVKVIIGDLSNTEQVLAGLGLK